MSLINKEDLMQTLGITNIDCEKCEWYSRTARMCKRGSDFEDACCAIDDAPEVDPVRKGKWIDKHAGIATCSECGVRWGVHSVMKFCPSCGAKMEEGE